MYSRKFYVSTLLCPLHLTTEQTVTLWLIFLTGYLVLDIYSERQNVRQVAGALADSVTASLAGPSADVNIGFILFSGFMVFIMQTGFLLVRT